MAIKNNLFVETNVMNRYAKFQLHPPYDFWGEDFWIFFENLPFMLPWQPIQFSDLDKIHMNHRGLLKKHFCKKKQNICSETAKIANFHFSYYKSMETITCHSNQSSYPIGTKNNIIRSPCLQMLCVKYGKNPLHGFRGDVVWKCWQRTTTDGRQMPPYTISSPMSLWFRWAKNSDTPWNYFHYPKFLTVLFYRML